MRINDVVRVLDDPAFGYGPIGHVDKLAKPFAHVVYDGPVDGQLEGWLLIEELEVVDVEKLERAVDGPPA